MTHQCHSEDGFVALIATIIISMVLLGAIAEESAQGIRARFNARGSEAHEETRALAEGCLARAIVDSARGTPIESGIIVHMPEGDCATFPIFFDNAGRASFHVRASVDDDFASVGEDVDFKDMTADLPLANPPPASSPQVIVVPHSFQEVARWGH